MKGLQGPINPCLFGEEHLDAESPEQERDILGFSYGHIVNTESLSFEEEELQQMPFLQMLQSVESPLFTEPSSFQVLLRLQHPKRPWDQMDPSTNRTTESCVTHDVSEMQSPAKSETKDHHHHPHSTSCVDGVSSDCNQEQPPNSSDKCCREGNSRVRPQTKASSRETRFSVSPVLVNRERRKRKRTRPAKNKEEVESQRMTHIAVERNRRRQMNDHLNAVRSLMPASYVQRGDQASIIGGAIDFVKELEQLLQSLEAQKRMRRAEEGGVDTSFSSSTSSAAVPILKGIMFTPSAPQQYRRDKLEGGSCTEEEEEEGGRSGEYFNKSAAAEIQVRVIQNHVNLKIECIRRPGQLLKAIVALEDLRLTVLHLNITSLEASVRYSFNLKIEDDCKFGSADDIAGTVHQIFNCSNG